MAVLLISSPKSQVAAVTAKRLKASNINYLYACRSGTPAEDGAPSVKFDILDESTWDAAINYEFPNGEKVETGYAIIPKVEDPVPAMIKLADYAKEKGVQRWIVVAGATAVYGEGPGKIWSHLAENGFDYAFLRPTWFADNFHTINLMEIKMANAISSCAGDGKLPWITVHDIGEVVYRLIVNEKPLNDAPLLVGPENLSYNQVAEKLSKLLGRTITHKQMTPAEREQQFLSFGVPAQQAYFLAQIAEAKIAKGGDEVKDPEALAIIEKITGKPAQTFDEYLEEHKAAWQ